MTSWSRWAPLVVVVSLLLLLQGTQGAMGSTLFSEGFDGLESSLRPAQDESIGAEVLGWTHDPPAGWHVDNGGMDPVKGVTEWRGWSFTTVGFWSKTDGQGREKFTLGEKVIAVADSDEYDDKDGPPAFDSTLVSPEIAVPAGKTVYVRWEHFCRATDKGTPLFLVSVNGGPEEVVLDYTKRGIENAEQMAVVSPPEGDAPWTVVLKWRYTGKNGWFWALDDVRVTDEVPAPPPPLGPLAGPEDWPTYRGDLQRSGVTAQELRFPLKPVWTHVPAHSPSPAWPPPARRDVSHAIPRLSPTTVFDRAYDVVAADGRLFYASSADDTVYCLDGATGVVQWVFTAEGPVRLAPTVAGERVFFGSDDGCAYCLDASSGALVWKHRGGPEDRRLPGNGRMISLWPVRTGIVVADDTVYFAAGLFPRHGAYLCALGAGDGEEKWKRSIDVPPQGHLLATPTALIVSTGRSAPSAYRRKDGKLLGGFEGLGGAFAVVLEDMLVHGPGEDGKLRINTPGTREKIVSTPGMSVLARDNMLYITAQRSLTALDRDRYVELSKQIQAIEQIRKDERTPEQHAEFKELMRAREGCRVWKTRCELPCGAILAGEAVITGGDGEAAAYDAATGDRIWESAVQGKAYGLSVSRGRLYVSTDMGTIHCFAADAEAPPMTVRAMPPAPELAEVGGGDAAMAEFLLRESGARQGYCLVLGSEGAGLVRELAKQSDLRVVGVASAEDSVRKAREVLWRVGQNGTRAAMHHVSGEGLPYPPYAFNLVVCVGGEGGPVFSSSELHRVLRPCGGVLLMAGRDSETLDAWNKAELPGWRHAEGPGGAWGVARRGALEGAGEWTHTYAEPGNTACSHDLRVGRELDLQWFGAPGPARMIDRHFRNVPPLSKDGRLFIPGERVVYAVDAYNGTPLWQVEVPDTMRTGVFLESSNMVLDAEALYLAGETVCRTFDVATGAAGRTYALPKPDAEWGYLARSGGLLFGSTHRPGTAYTELSNKAQLEERAVWYPNMKLAVSDSIFAMHADTGAVAWTYGNGRILDATIALGDGRVFLVETHSPKALADTTGRLMVRDITQEGEQFLVSLDAATGETRYRVPIDMRSIQQPCFLVFAKETLLLSGARILGGESVVESGKQGLWQLAGKEAVQYHFYAFDAATGALRWEANQKTSLNADGAHGEYNRHPTIIDGVAYTWPYAYNLVTGERLADWAFDRRGHGCGGISASQHMLFWRGNNPWMYDLGPGGGASRLTTITRPGCWINIIPAGGLVLLPEASSGCTCAYPVQTSMAFAPR